MIKVRACVGFPIVSYMTGFAGQVNFYFRVILGKATQGEAAQKKKKPFYHRLKSEKL